MTLLIESKTMRNDSKDLGKLLQGVPDQILGETIRPFQIKITLWKLSVKRINRLALQLEKIQDPAALRIFISSHYRFDSPILPDFAIKAESMDQARRALIAGMGHMVAKKREKIVVELRVSIKEMVFDHTGESLTDHNIQSFIDRLFKEGTDR